MITAETINSFVNYVLEGNYKSAQDLISNELKSGTESSKELQDKFNEFLITELTKPSDFWGIAKVLDDYPKLKNFILLLGSSVN